MANKLFKDLNVKNHVKRSGFDLSHNVKFTASSGMLLPIMHRTLMFGDHIEITTNSFTRTASVQTAAMTQIREYFDYFFVPYRLLWKNTPNVLVQNTENPVIATSISSNQSIGTQLPQINLQELFTPLGDPNGVYSENPSPLMNIQTSGNPFNFFGFSRVSDAFRLLNHLGYSYFTNEQIVKFLIDDNTDPVLKYDYLPTFTPYASAFPLLAYHKIYYDFFRNSAWEDNQPYNYNVDYLSSSAILTFPQTGDSYYDSPTLFDLHYSNYPKDLFFGLLPDSQYGDESVATVDATEDGTNFANLRSENGSITTIAAADGLLKIPNTDSNVNTYTSPLGVKLDSLGGQLSILELRRAQFRQKYKEIVGSGARDYQTLVDKIFNVQIPDDLADHCIYLGGHTTDVHISEVVNTNLADGNDAEIKGKGTASGNGNRITFDCKEPGVIMCIYHAQPVIDYALDAYHFDVLKTEVDDYANPVFDSLGYQELPIYYLTSRLGRNAPTGVLTTNTHIGYTSRYFDYKTSVDMVLGGFREDDLQSWISPINLNYIKDFIVGTGPTAHVDINANWFKVNPSILDSIFGIDYDGTVLTDQLRVSVNFDIQAVRNLDYLGLPY